MDTFQDVSISGTALLTLPNGDPLTFALWKDKGFSRINAPTDQLHHKEKKRNARACNRNTSGQVIVFADFDKLPANLLPATIQLVRSNDDCPLFSNSSYNEHDAYDKLERYLQQCFTNSETRERHGIVFRSISGKVKVLSVLEGEGITKKTVLDYWRRTLPKEHYPDLFKCIGKGGSDLFVTFLTPSIINALSNELPALKPVFVEGDVDRRNRKFFSKFEGVDSSSLEIRNSIYYNPISSYEISKELNNNIIESSITGLSCRTPPTKYHLYEGTIDAGIFECTQTNETMEGLIRILLHPLTSKLATDGFDLCQSIVGETLGVSQELAGRYLRRLCSMGLLEKTTRAAKGFKAITYKAQGVLKEVIEQLYLHGRTNPTPLPNSIPDGTWEETIGTHMWYYGGNPKQFLKDISKIPGSNLKDRKQKARQAFKNLCRKYGKDSFDS